MSIHLKTILLSLVVLINFSGCAKNKNNPIYLELADSQADSIEPQNNLNDLIADISKQLKQTTRLNKSHLGSIAVTSFVNLDKFTQTNKFGRLLSESMLYELYIQGFNVADFRGKHEILINKNGEFFISRDITKLNKQFDNTYVLVGTYSTIDKLTYINIRIMDNTTGTLVASARSIYTNRITKKIVKKVKPKPVKPKKIKPKYKIQIKGEQ